MNSVFPINDKTPVMLLDRPLIGLASPEFQNFMSETIQAIGRSTKKLFRSMRNTFGSVLKFIQQKNLEGDELYRRSQMARAALNERYANQGFMIRNYL